jgi:hypothetical protein
MSADLKDLPENISRAVILSRTLLAPASSAPFVAPTVDPRVAQWAARVIEDGRLAAALQEIANNDQDLAD